MVGVLLLLEMAVVAQPAVRAGVGDLTPANRPIGPHQGMLLASCTILLVTAGAGLATMLVRPRSRTWVATFTAAHAAAAALGWAHGLPLLTLVSALAASAVPALVLLPEQPPQ
ncbi:hypothetical protein C8E97_5968 [Saccharothrix australiensis]|uniref:Uncharacterized protein n=1 Tax=Saccharothrix australiensis TaxID=2072 RepID=A0A495W838_9PSEU|nr:hypothetical protein C8E97_5968 [Saccharothrix australiensis]